MKRLGC